MINAVQSILSMFIMIFIGWMMTRKKFFNKETSKLFSSLIFNLALPVLMFYSVSVRFTKQELLHFRKGILVGFGVILTAFFIGVIILKIVSKDKKGNSILSTMFAQSNTIFLGLPVCIGVFGEKSISYVLLYYFANTTIFWTVGFNRVKKECNVKEDNGIIIGIIKKIFSPPLIGFLIALLFIIVGIKIPEFIMTTCKYIGGLTTPLCMFVIGIMIYYIDLKEHKFDIRYVVVLIGKFIVLPVIMIIVVQFIDIPSLLKKVFIIEASMPMMTQAAIVSRKCEIEEDSVPFLVGLSTALSLVITPFYIYVINILGI
ncbi:AEC family transporter [Haloimpatiens sp. FM7330]|uniref:AEC family transporter n=1 Tax=Haloimpatiens sp. FM7330 TaxID=3298610 RepID=UPI00363DFFCF